MRPIPMAKSFRVFGGPGSGPQGGDGNSDEKSDDRYFKSENAKVAKDIKGIKDKIASSKSKNEAMQSAIRSAANSMLDKLQADSEARMAAIRERHAARIEKIRGEKK